jgi:serine/tyrosine/threonine adenylyltransferase
MASTSHTLKFNFDNTYVQLPADFYSPVHPTPVPSPKLVLYNNQLAQELGLSAPLEDTYAVASILAGNTLPEGSLPIAQAYAGHQFGYFTLLGDGRAHLLGEHITPDNQRYDIQLKGSGPTPYSRRGDGRATLKSMLREYLISEAMHALGIPTSRSLAVIATGEQVYREPIQHGAVLTRVMQSHIRVGTFEYVKRFLQPDDLRIFATYVIQRHYPELQELDYPGLPLLEKVMEKQIQLVVQWMRVGFIHGVMNTDNMSIAGETFDYGPCAFMNVYNPSTVFSSIDQQGRYAFANQPGIVQWNLSVLAAALLPLMGEHQEKAVVQAKALLNAFEADFNREWNHMMAQKLGFKKVDQSTNSLAIDFLQWMDHKGLDYTNTFIELTELDFSQAHYDDVIFQTWQKDWFNALNAQGISTQSAQSTMRAVNPYYIPRNHIVEDVLTQAEYGNIQPFLDFFERLQTPYIQKTSDEYYRNVPPGADENHVTYCGT